MAPFIHEVGKEGEMKKILFTLCIAAILIASYKIGLKTGEFKAFPDGYWQGMEDDLYYW